MQVVTENFGHHGGQLHDRIERLTALIQTLTAHMEGYHNHIVGGRGAGVSGGVTELTEMTELTELTEIGGPPQYLTVFGALGGLKCNT